MGLTKIHLILLPVLFFIGCSQSEIPSDGKLAGNIVGGELSTPEFQRENGIVALTVVTARADLCAGTLITRRIVLTAAHCVIKNGQTVPRVFATFATSLVAVDGLTAASDLVREGVRILAHPTFPNIMRDQAGEIILDQSEGMGDIALILLSHDAPAEFKTAKLAESQLYTRPGRQLIQAGFGRTVVGNTPDPNWRILHHVGQIESMRRTADGLDLILKEDGKGSCGGDSGGPAFAQSSRGGLVLVGINSRGLSRENCLGEGVYTNVASYTRWIRQSVRELKQFAAEHN